MDLSDLWEWPQGPRGYLKAIDPLTGKTKWENGSDIPRFSGVLSTGGGVVFSGQLTGEFEAFDAETGKKLWQFQTGSGIEGQPITWQQDGVQYVAVASGIRRRLLAVLRRHAAGFSPRRRIALGVCSGSAVRQRTRSRRRDLVQLSRHAMEMKVGLRAPRDHAGRDNAGLAARVRGGSDTNGGRAIRAGRRRPSCQRQGAVCAQLLALPWLQHGQSRHRRLRFAAVSRMMTRRASRIRWPRARTAACRRGATC